MVKQNIVKQKPPVELPKTILFEDEYIKVVGGIEISMFDVYYTITNQSKNKTKESTTCTLGEHLIKNNQCYNVLGNDLYEMSFKKNEKGLRRAVEFLFTEFESDDDQNHDISKHFNRKNFFHFIKKSQEKAYNKHKELFIIHSNEIAY